jgi:hypothetical protein
MPLQPKQQQCEASELLVFLHRDSAAQTPFVHHAANLRHLSGVRIQRQSNVQIRVGLLELAFQVVGVSAIAVRAPVRLVDTQRFGAITNRDVRLVLRRVRRTQVRQSGGAISRRRGTIEAQRGETNTFVVLLGANRFSAGGEIFVRDTEYGTAIGLLLC